MKLGLIIDSSEAFISFQKEILLEEWGAEELQRVDSISSVGGVTLFGPTPTSILELENTEHVRKVLKELEKEIENGTLTDTVSSGLVITSSLNKNSTRKLQKTLEPYAQNLIGSSKNLTETIVKQYMNLNYETEEFLLNYLGQDYDAALPLARSIRKLSPEQQQKISIQSIYYRLPKPPGGVPPWEIENPLWEGDYSTAVEIYRRVVAGSGALLPLYILNKKVKMIYQSAVLLETEPRMTNAQIAKILKVPNNYPLRLAVEKARQLGVEKSERLLELLAGAESSIKGGRGLPENTMMELMLLKFIRIVER